MREQCSTGENETSQTATEGACLKLFSSLCCSCFGGLPTSLREWLILYVDKSSVFFLCSTGTSGYDETRKNVLAEKHQLMFPEHGVPFFFFFNFRAVN